MSIGTQPKMTDGLGSILQPLKVACMQQDYKNFGFSCVAFEVGKNTCNLGSDVHLEELALTRELLHEKQVSAAFFTSL